MFVLGGFFGDLLDESSVHSFVILADRPLLGATPPLLAETEYSTTRQESWKLLCLGTLLHAFVSAAPLLLCLVCNLFDSADWAVLIPLFDTVHSLMLTTNLSHFALAFSGHTPFHTPKRSIWKRAPSRTSYVEWCVGGWVDFRIHQCPM